MQTWSNLLRTNNFVLAMFSFSIPTPCETNVCRRSKNSLLKLYMVVTHKAWPFITENVDIPSAQEYVSKKRQEEQNFVCQLHLVPTKNKQTRAAGRLVDITFGTSPQERQKQSKCGLEGRATHNIFNDIISQRLKTYQNQRNWFPICWNHKTREPTPVVWKTVASSLHLSDVLLDDTIQKTKFGKPIG